MPLPVRYRDRDTAETGIRINSFVQINRRTAEQTVLSETLILVYSNGQVAMFSVLYPGRGAEGG